MKYTLNRVANDRITYNDSQKRIFAELKRLAYFKKLNDVDPLMILTLFHTGSSMKFINAYHKLSQERQIDLLRMFGDWLAGEVYIESNTTNPENRGGR